MATKDEKKSNPPANQEPPKETPKIVERIERVVVSKDVQLGSVTVTIKPDEKILTWTDYPDKVVYYVEGPKTGQKGTVMK